MKKIFLKNEGVDLIRKWKSTKIGSNKVRYACYKKVDMAVLEELYEQYKRVRVNDKSASIEGFIDSDTRPKRANILLYLLEHCNEEKGLTQAMFEYEVNKAFSKFGISMQQPHISEQLSKLSIPFYYGDDGKLYVVARKGVRRNYTYSLEEYKGGLEYIAQVIALDYAKYVNPHKPFILTTTPVMIEGIEENVASALVYKVKTTEIVRLRQDLKSKFDKNLFFGMMINAGHLVIMLNTEHESFVEFSNVLENMFSSLE
ncbi:MAG: hypothetical protein IJ947_02955 [Phascolarctobacterium sp.]|nr:hypothetical protein [Phascolarctobacterium sp.]